MEQIPTEVMEKIRIAVEDFYGSEQSGEYKSTYEKGCECGYRLASPCALCEGKDEYYGTVITGIRTLYDEMRRVDYEKIKELEKECEGKEKENIGLQNACKKWEEICEGKEKEIAELKKINQSWANSNDKLIESKSQRISELEAGNEFLTNQISARDLKIKYQDKLLCEYDAEKERLKGLIARMYNEFIRSAENTSPSVSKDNWDKFQKINNL